MRFKMTTEIPASITTPDRVDTRLGSLEFFDGFRSRDTVATCFENLLLMRGVEAFLSWIPAASLVAASATEGQEYSAFHPGLYLRLYPAGLMSSPGRLRPRSRLSACEPP